MDNVYCLACKTPDVVTVINDVNQGAPFHVSALLINRSWHG